MTVLVPPAREVDGATAAELWVAARHAADGGRWLASRDLALRALARWPVDAPHDEDLRMRILVALAYNESELGRFRQAHAHLDRAAPAEGPVAPAVRIARAMILVRTGRPDEALADFDEAIAHLRGDTTRCTDEDLGGALVNRGLLHITAGRLDPAEADTAEALAIGRRKGLGDLVAIAQHNLGYLLYLRGDLPAALASMTPDHPDGDREGVCLLDRSRVLTAAGLLDEATDLLDESLGLLVADGATADMLEAHLLHADLDLRRGLPDAALHHADRAAELARRRRNRPAVLVSELLRLRAQRGDRGPDPAVAARLAARLDAAGLPDEARNARLLQAEGLVTRGRWDEATAVLGTLTGRAVMLSGRLHERLVRAGVAVAMGDRRRGFDEIRRGLDELARFQATFGSQDMQAALPVHGADLAQAGVRLALDSGSPARVLQWLERARGVTTRMPQVRPVADPVLAERLSALRVGWGQARAAVLGGGEVDRELGRRLQRLRHQIRSHVWGRGGHQGAVTGPPPLAEVTRRLQEWPDGARPVVLAGFRADDDLHVLVVTARRALVRPWGTKAELVELGGRLRADLDLLAADRVPPRLAEVARRSLAAGLDRLDRLLLQPLARVLDEDGQDAPLLLSGVGTLATLPWSCVPRLRGRPLTVNSSVSASLRRARRADGSVLPATGPGPVAAAAEVAAVADCHPDGRAMVGVTGADLLGALPGARLLHVAAHGRHETQSPLFSHVELQDGPLYAYDLAQVPLPPQVVLSACEVGRSDARVGEPLGLAAALLRSGVDTVVAGVSRVGDEVAAAVMADYHRGLAAGRAPAQALAAATVSAPGPAAFTCFGAGW